MDLRQAALRAQKLQADVDRLMQNVLPDVGSDHPVYPVEMCHDALLRPFIAGLVIDSPASDSQTVWPLLEARVPAELLSDAQVQQEKEFLSRPLACTPTALLMRIRLLNDKSTWASIDRHIRANHTPEQKQVLFLIEIALWQ
jgi:hypothetical protein